MGRCEVGAVQAVIFNGLSFVLQDVGPLTILRRAAGGAAIGFAETAASAASIPERAAGCHSSCVC
jgi:hypothetical protein